MSKITEVTEIEGTQLSEAKIQEIWGKVQKFAEYGFNKSHAAAYGMLSFQTAYLKAHHPYAFYAASMNLDINNAEKLAEFVREMRHETIRLERPDVQTSEATFTVAHDGDGQPRAVRYALAAIRGVGVNAMRALVAERARGGRFRDYADLVQRLSGELNNKAFESLVNAGACDSLPHTRAAMLQATQTLTRAAQKERERRASQQVSLFDAGLDAPAPMTVPDKPEDPRLDLLEREYAALGAYMSGHPLDGMTRILKAAGTHTIAQAIAPDHPRRETKIGAMITSMQVRQTRKQETMAVLTISDPTGLYEAVAFPEDYQRMRQSLTTGQAFIFTLGIGERNGFRQLFVRNIEPLQMQLAESA